jgi:CheY-like chemotaxis protein
MAKNQTGTILLIEDDLNDAELLRRALRKANLHTPVAVVEDGEAAIRWLSTRIESPPANGSERPKIILLDLKMPRMSGWEVLEWLRRQPGGHGLPVIVLTSSQEEEDVARAYKLGVNSYLVKPVSFDELKDMIRSVHHYWMDLNEQPNAE